MKVIYRNIFCFFCLTFLYLFSYGFQKEVPNQIITENPYKKVTTIEANKNRDHANLNITINKINTISINGFRNKNNIFFSIKKDKHLKKNPSYGVIRISNFTKKYDFKSKQLETPTIMSEDDDKINFKIPYIEGSKSIYLLDKNNYFIYRINLDFSPYLGSVTFNVDRRFLTFNRGNWLDYKGRAFSDITGSVQVPDVNFKNFIKIDSNLKSLVTNTTFFPEEISGMKYRSKFSFNEEVYYLYAPGESAWNEIAIPVLTSLSRLPRFVVFSKYGDNNIIEKNVVTYIAKGTDASDMFTVDFIEHIAGEAAVEGDASIDLTKLKQGEFVGWSSASCGATGTVSPDSGDSASGVSMQVTKNKIFHWVSHTDRKPAVTKIRVSNGKQTFENSVKDPGSHLIVSFPDNDLWFEQDSFSIQKRKSTSYPITYRIEAYYHDVLLGILNLTVINSKDFSIIDDGGINFGDFFPGDIKQGETKIKLQNSQGANISITSSNNKNEMVKIGSKKNINTTIPIKNILIKKEKDFFDKDGKVDTFKLSAVAETNKNTEVGEYKGTLDLTITIVPK